MNFFIKKDQINEKEVYIKGTDVNHIKNVLRKKSGDIISVILEGIEHKVQIKELTSEFIKCEIIEAVGRDLEDEPRLTIFQGLAKADKIEYIIQKCTELGAYEIIPVEMKRCVVKLNGNDKVKKIERWQKIAEVAAKQSERNDILKIDKILNFEQMCETFNNYDYVIMAYEKEKENSLRKILKNIDNVKSKIAVVIGPEGGIDDGEAKKMIQNGAKSVSLGKRILRTEKAPVAISAIIMYEFEER